MVPGGHRPKVRKGETGVGQLDRGVQGVVCGRAGEIKTVMLMITYLQLTGFHGSLTTVLPWRETIYYVEVENKRMSEEFDGGAKRKSFWGGDTVGIGRMRVAARKDNTTSVPRPRSRLPRPNKKPVQIL